jgi:hypothetical protein
VEKTTHDYLNDLYFPTKIIRVIEENEMGGVCNTYGKRRCAYRVLVGKPEGKRTLGRPRCK